MEPICFTARFITFLRSKNHNLFLAVSAFGYTGDFLKMSLFNTSVDVRRKKLLSSRIKKMEKEMKQEKRAFEAVNTSVT